MNDFSIKNPYVKGLFILSLVIFFTLNNLALDNVVDKVIGVGREFLYTYVDVHNAILNEIVEGGRWIYFKFFTA